MGLHGYFLGADLFQIPFDLVEKRLFCVQVFFKGSCIIVTLLSTALCDLPQGVKFVQLAISSVLPVHVFFGVLQQSLILVVQLVLFGNLVAQLGFQAFYLDCECFLLLVESALQALISIFKLDTKQAVLDLEVLACLLQSRDLYKAINLLVQRSTPVQLLLLY